MASSVDLVLRVLGDTRGASKAVDETAGRVSKLKAGVGKAAIPAALAFGAIAAGALDAAKAAAEDEHSQSILANTMAKTTGANKAQIAANEDWIASMAQASGVADDQLRPALGNLLRATGDVAKSHAALKTAMDVSTATGKPLDAVTSAIAKGYGGSTTALGKLVPGISQAALKSKDMTKIMGELAKKTGGATAAAADTAAGKMARATNAFNEAKESVGGALLPVLAQFATAMATVGLAVQQHSKAFVTLAAAIGSIALAVLLVNAAFKVYQATLLVVNAVQKATFLTNPIFLVVLAIVAIVAAVILLWKKSETFRAVVLGVWSAIKTAAGAVASFIKAAWTAVWTAIQSVAGAVASWLTSTWQTVWGVLSAAARVVGAVLAAVFAPIAAVASVVGALILAVWRVVFALLSLYVRLWLAVIMTAFNLVKALAAAVANVIAAVWRVIWPPISAAARAFAAVLAAVWSAITSAARAAASLLAALWRAIWAPLSAAARAFGSAINAVWTSVKTAISSVVSWISDKWSGLWSTLKTAAGSATDALTAPFDAVKQAVQDVIDFLDKLAKKISSIKIPSIKIPGVGKSTSAALFGSVRRSATSTLVPGMAGPVGVRSAATSAVMGAGLTINVYGVLDGADAARKIRAVLTTDDRRRTGVRIAGMSNA